MTGNVSSAEQPRQAAYPPVDPTAFTDAFRAFTAARETGAPMTERWLTIADHPVRLRCVGSTLANRLEHAFPHRIDAPDPDARANMLAIDLWDAGETGVAFASAGTGELACSTDGRVVRFGLPHASSWLDRSAPSLVSCVHAADRLQPADVYQPFGPLLAIWLADRGRPSLHAGAVSIDGQGVLLTGRAGAGKSTTTISCLLDGWDYLGDDFVALSAASDATYLVHGVYGMAHLVVPHVSAFRELPARAVHFPVADGKAVVDLAGTFGARMAASARIRAVVLPRITPGGDTRLVPASKSAAMLAMAPASMFLRGSANPAAFHLMAALVENVPTYWLEMGQDLSTIAPALRPLTEAE